jgi:drug/metabolite transporter (DMT)-like permease
LVFTTVLSGLVTAFCWGTSDYLSRRQSERVGHYKTVVYSQLVTLLILVILLPVLSPGLNFSALPVLALCAAGALNFVAFVFLYRAFHIGVVSVVAPIAYTYPAATALLSVVILGTFLSLSESIAIASIIAGVVLLSTRFSELRAFAAGSGSPNLTAGVRSAIGSSLFFGTVYIGVGYATPMVSYVLPPLILRLMGVAIGFALAPLVGSGIRPSRLAFSNTILAMGVLEAAGFLVFTHAIYTASGSLPVVAALSGMGGAVAAAYGLAFLRERLEWNQLIGVLLSIVGVFTLLYFGG